MADIFASNIMIKMKNLFKTLFVSIALVGTTACETETELVEIPDSTIQEIAQAAATSAVNAATAAVNSAAAAAANAAASQVASQINNAVDSAVASATSNNDSVDETRNVGTGGITEITTNVTWTNDRVWIMDGKIVVQSGGTLTIEAGTIIKAQNGQQADATALIVAKGGTLNANGTAANPIIFTDIEDQISYSNNGVSPNRRATDTGKWGGVIILGRASVGEDGGSDDIEGIVSGYDWTTYGGSDDADNSGSITYVSIRHSGTQLGNGDEIQGLTLGGVGSGTTINNIEVVGSNDDGIEIFGGSVNVSNVVILNQRDDALDLDEGYKGTVSNAVIQMRNNSDNPFEIDGTEDSTGTIDGAFTVENVTVFGAANPEAGKNNLGDWKSDATGLTKNVVYQNVNNLAIKGIDADTYNGTATSASLGNLNFAGFEFISTSTLADIFANTTVTDYSNWASVVTTPTVGADTTGLQWTLWYNLQN